MKITGNSAPECILARVFSFSTDVWDVCTTSIEMLTKKKSFTLFPTRIEAFKFYTIKSCDDFDELKASLRCPVHARLFIKAMVFNSDNRLGITELKEKVEYFNFLSY